MKVPRLPWLAIVAVLAAAGVAALGLGRWLELAPDATNRLRDDAYYEFAWAANLAAGNGPTVSDGVTTSGVQLAWSLLLVPFAWLLGAAALPAVAPWLGALLHGATACLWWRSTRDRVTGFCVAACWLGNPLLVRESQNGQETALACLLLSALWLHRRAGERSFALLAILTVLARSDLLPAVAALSASRHGFVSWRTFVAPGLALAALVLLNVLLGGSWLPDSAMPMAWLSQQRQGLPLADSDWWQHAWWFARPVLLGGPWAMASAMGLGFLVFLVVRAWWPASLRAVPALAVGSACALGARDLATAGWTALLLALAPSARRRAPPRALTLLLAGVTAIIVLHWAIRWYPRDYYAAPLVVAAAAAMQRFGRVRLILVVWALAQLQDWRRVGEEPLAGQREMEMAGRFVATALPANERIGCFNSGLVTFHAAVLASGDDRHGVVNLDGVVDARSFAALRRARLSEYLDEQGVRFVLDNPIQFVDDRSELHACGRWFGDGFDAGEDLVEVARFDVPDVGGSRPGADSMRLYWRRSRGEPPKHAVAVRDLGAAPDGGRYVLWPAKSGQVLEGEGEQGARVVIAAADAHTQAIVLVPRRALVSGRLWVRGDATPVLNLPKL